MTDNSQVNIRIPQQTVDRIDVAKAVTGVHTRAGFILRAVISYLDQLSTSEDFKSKLDSMASARPHRFDWSIMEGKD